MNRPLPLSCGAAGGGCTAEVLSLLQADRRLRTSLWRPWPELQAAAGGPGGQGGTLPCRSWAMAASRTRYTHCRLDWGRDKAGERPCFLLNTGSQSTYTHWRSCFLLNNGSQSTYTHWRSCFQLNTDSPTPIGGLILLPAEQRQSVYLHPLEVLFPAQHGQSVYLHLLDLLLPDQHGQSVTGLPTPRSCSRHFASVPEMDSGQVSHSASQTQKASCEHSPQSKRFFQFYCNSCCWQHVGSTLTPNPIDANSPPCPCCQQ